MTGCLSWKAGCLIILSVSGHCPQPWVAEVQALEQPTRFVVSTTLGKSPNTTPALKLLLDTGSANTWVAGRPCAACNDNPLRRFDYHQSESFERRNLAAAIQFGTGTVAGINGREHMSILNPAKPSEEFHGRLSIGVVLLAEGFDFNAFGFEGILGLGRKHQLDYGFESLWNQSCPDGVITIQLPNSKNATGVISVSDEPTDEEGWWPTSFANKWALGVKEVRLGDIRLWPRNNSDHPDSLSILIDTGSLVHTLDSAGVTELTNLIHQLGCPRFLDADKYSVIEYKLVSGGSLKVPIKQYLSPDSCRLRTTNIRPLDREGVIILGAPALRTKIVQLKESNGTGHIRFKDV